MSTRLGCRPAACFTTRSSTVRESGDCATLPVGFGTVPSSTSSKFWYYRGARTPTVTSWPNIEITEYTLVRNEDSAPAALARHTERTTTLLVDDLNLGAATQPAADRSIAVE